MLAALTMNSWKSTNSLAEIFDCSQKTISRLIDGMMPFVGSVYPPESVLTKPKRVNGEAFLHWMKWKEAIQNGDDYPRYKNKPMPVGAGHELGK